MRHFCATARRLGPGRPDGTPGKARRGLARLERAKAAIRANFHVKNRQTAAVRWSGYGITL